MAYEPASVTKIRAKDGSLHGSRADAEAHDRWRAEGAIEAAVQDVVEQETWQGELSEFCGYQHTQQTRIYDENSYERDSRNRAIARIIIDKWDALCEIMEKRDA